MRADDVPVFLAATDQQELAVEERLCRDCGFERVAAAVHADRAARDELAGLTLALGDAAQHQELGQLEARGVELALLDFARGRLLERLGQCFAREASDVTGEQRPSRGLGLRARRRSVQKLR